MYCCPQVGHIFSNRNSLGFVRLVSRDLVKKVCVCVQFRLFFNKSKSMWLKSDKWSPLSILLSLGLTAATLRLDYIIPLFQSFWLLFTVVFPIFFLSDSSRNSCSSSRILQDYSLDDFHFSLLFQLSAPFIKFILSTALSITVLVTYHSMIYKPLNTNSPL